MTSGAIGFDAQQALLDELARDDEDFSRQGADGCSSISYGNGAMAAGGKPRMC
ncbi:MAG: hypothetical protein R3E89_20155 [Thiolinea sp.]